MSISVGDDVIFRREIINNEFLMEFGTSAVYLVYIVTRQVDNKVFIKPPFGFEFDVSIDDIERTPDDFNQATVIKPFINAINELEKAS